MKELDVKNSIEKENVKKENKKKQLKFKIFNLRMRLLKIFNPKKYNLLIGKTEPQNKI